MTSDQAGNTAGSDTLDLMGLKCPLPVLKTKKAMSRLETGTRLTVLTTDPMAVLDIPHFCREDGHRLIDQSETGTGHRFVLEKG